MNHSTHDIDLIERYFDQQLTEDEKAKLTERLTTDPELKILFDQEKLLINTIRYQAASQDLQFLKSLERTLENPVVTQDTTRWYYAAAAIGALAIAAFVLIPWSKPSPQDLYAEYFVPYPNVFEPARRSRGTGTDERTLAFQAYDLGNYEEASRRFSRLPDTEKDPGMLLLLGNAQLMIGKSEEAKATFQQLISEYDELDIQGKWFLSLCYLRTGEMEEAKRLLDELGSMEVSYAGKAKELLKEVD